ncbi:hypothetical protein DES39_0388 [Orbus hercynius]|uniref:Uncharacterized protein n=1 Tax=Orbus hercynius TaxID=593135 RepID=A0A495RIE3_9GAMM|nr:hypothetical protein [Orbus hercynius]RKS87171.1 hypothetical protein DES39_0388 [Orbus hercynius]
MATAKNELYEEVKAWAENAIFHSPTWSINQLDYSEKSISVVEVILSEMAEKSLLLTEDQVTMLTQEYGCYLLFTAYKLYGGEFFWHGEQEQPMLIVGEPEANIVLLTWHKVKGRLMGDKLDNVAYFLEQFGNDASAPHAGKKVIYL